MEKACKVDSVRYSVEALSLCDLARIKGGFVTVFPYFPEFRKMFIHNFAGADGNQDGIEVFKADYHDGILQVFDSPCCDKTSGVGKPQH